MIVSTQQQNAYECLKFFENTPKFESEFYLRFLEMDREDKNLLLSFYQLNDKGVLFNFIKKFWNVKQ